MSVITRLEKIDPKIAVDLIDLINNAKGFEKKGNAKFKNVAYNWVLLDDILDYLKKSENWAVLQPMGTNDDGEESIKIVMIHKSGEIIQSDWIKLGYKDTDNSQDKGIKGTYVRRYSLGSWLGIAVGSDNDGKELDKTDEELAKEVLKQENTKSQKEITSLFEKLITKYGTKDDVYYRLGTNRDAFLTDYNNQPKDLLEQIKKVFGNVE